MKIKNLLSLLVTSLLTFTVVACGPSTSGPDDNGNDKDPCSKCDLSTQKCENGQCVNKEAVGGAGADCSGTQKHARCNVDTPTSFGKATLIDNLVFYKNTKVVTKDDNTFGSLVSLMEVGGVVINDEVGKALKAHDVVLVAEFSDWKNDTPPTSQFPIFFWQGNAPSAGKVSVKKNGNNGSFSSSYLSATVKESGDLKTQSGSLVIPINTAGLNIEGKVVDAKIIGTVESENGGVKLTNGKISGFILKDEMFDALAIGVERACGKCATMVNTPGKKWFSGIDKTCASKLTPQKTADFCEKIDMLKGSDRDALPIPILNGIFNLVKDGKPAMSITLGATGVPINIESIVTN